MCLSFSSFWMLAAARNLKYELLIENIDREKGLWNWNVLCQVNLAHQSGAMFSIIDSRMGSYPSECVERFVALGIKCCQDKPDERPSIVDVVRELENILRIMPETGVDSSESKSKYYSESVSSSSMSANTSRDPCALSSNSGGDLSGVTLTVTPRWHLKILCFFIFPPFLFCCSFPLCEILIYTTCKEKYNSRNPNL